MKRFVLLAVLMLGMASNVWAWECPKTIGPTTQYSCITQVYNDSGSALTSGTVVIWDNDDTEFDRSGYPYVTTSTSADSPHVAGVIQTGSCSAGAMCDMIEYGFAWTRIAHSTDAAAEDDLVGTTSVAGQAGGYAAGTADNCALGHVLELYNKESASGTVTSVDNQVFPVFVHKECE